MPEQIEHARKKGIFVGRNSDDVLRAGIISYVPSGCIQFEVGPDIALVGCFAPTDPHRLDQVVEYVQDRIQMEPKVYHVYETITLVEGGRTSPYLDTLER